MPTEALGWFAAGWCLFANSIHVASTILARGGGARPTGPGIPISRLSVVAPMRGEGDASPEYLDALAGLQREGAEVLICVADASDGAAEVVRRHWLDAGQGHPPLLIGALDTFNPKMNNAAKGFDMARGDVVALCDAGVLLDGETVAGAMGALSGRVGLVLALKWAEAGEGAAAALEAAWIDGHQARFLLAADRLGIPVASGGVTFIDRATLNRVGGWRGFFGYIADDYAIARSVRRTGLGTRLSASMPRVRLGRRSWAAVWDRQVRWARTRLRLPVWPLVIWEPAVGLASAVAVGLAALCILIPDAGSTEVAAYLGMQIALWMAAEFAFLTGHDARAGWRAILAGLARELLTWPLLATALLGRDLVWRGSDLGGDWRRGAARDGEPT